MLPTDPTMTLHPDDSLQIFVYSRAHIERLAPHDDAAHVIISITTTPSDVARLPVCEQTLGVLRLSFFDLDGPAHGAEEAQLFGPSDAVKIWDLQELHKPKLARVIVHCDAGFSRSPAVAAAIARVYLGDDAWYFRRYLPNRRVHRMLLEEAASRGLL
jgi:predicted protein tyrosine phosphatase